MSVTAPGNPVVYTIYFKMLTFQDSPQLVYLLSNHYPPEFDSLPIYDCVTFETRLKEYYYPNIKCCDLTKFMEIAQAMNKENQRNG